MNATSPRLIDRLADLTAFRDRDLLDANLVAVLRDLLHPTQAAIHRCVGHDDELRWLTSARLGRDDAVPVSDPVWTALEALPHLDEHPARVQALHLQAVVVQPGLPSVAIFPLAQHRDGAGVLELQTAQPLGTHAFRQVGSILRVFRNFQSLLDASERDTLTGLLNRTTFDSAFNRATGARPLPLPPPPDAAPAGLQGAGQRSLPAASQPHFIGVIDIDHFKRVNDAFGHLIGDEVLLLLSRLMRSVFRYHDRIYRFGGEEFVVLMRCHGDAEAGLALQRLREALQRFAFPQAGLLTVSMGYAQVRPGDTPRLAFDRADRAVYWAKQHGRDQVCSFADLAAQGALVDDLRSGDVELF